jgi:hypothetical protein
MTNAREDVSFRSNWLEFALSKPERRSEVAKEPVPDAEGEVERGRTVTVEVGVSKEEEVLEEVGADEEEPERLGGGGLTGDTGREEAEDAEVVRERVRGYLGGGGVARELGGLPTLEVEAAAVALFGGCLGG